MSLAPKAPATNFMLIIGGLVKMSQTVKVSYFSNPNLLLFQKSEGKLDLILKLIFVCFQKVSMLYSRVGHGSGSVGTHQKNFPDPEPHQDDAAPQH
jgi:hypothetical protein